jgi:hypothetical protein
MDTLPERVPSGDRLSGGLKPERIIRDKTTIRRGDPAEQELRVRVETTRETHLTAGTKVPRLAAGSKPVKKLRGGHGDLHVSRFSCQL